MPRKTEEVVLSSGEKMVVEVVEDIEKLERLPAPHHAEKIDHHDAEYYFEEIAKYLFDDSLHQSDDPLFHFSRRYVARTLLNLAFGFDLNMSGNIEDPPDELTNYPDVELDPVYRFLRKSDSDPEIARAILLSICYYIKSKRPIPRIYREHLVHAIETAMERPPDRRGSELSRALRLTSGHVRPRKGFDFIDVALQCEQLECDPRFQKNENKSRKKIETLIAEEVALKFPIEYKTVLKHWKKYREIQKEIRSNSPEVEINKIK